MNPQALELAGLEVLQDLAKDTVPEQYGALASIALGIVEDLIRSGVPNPEVVLQSMRDSVKGEWREALKERFPNG